MRSLPRMPATVPRILAHSPRSGNEAQAVEFLRSKLDPECYPTHRPGVGTFRASRKVGRIANPSSMNDALLRASPGRIGNPSYNWGRTTGELVVVPSLCFLTATWLAAQATGPTYLTTPVYNPAYGTPVTYGRVSGSFCAFASTWQSPWPSLPVEVRESMPRVERPWMQNHPRLKERFRGRASGAAETPAGYSGQAVEYIGPGN